jgi:hypothetical protein
MPGAFKVISQTFRDVILITRKLGFRYIWIDSFFILQDRAEDWRKESASMKDVYKGCMFNIAATAASNGANSLFAARDLFVISPFIVDIARNNTRQHYDCFRGAVKFDGFVKAALNRRRWVYQEHLLNPRTIHISTQLY